LHPSDTEKLNKVIDQIVAEGNTVVTVEHNPEIIRQANYILEMGPEAGMNGGKITASGSIREIKSRQTETAKMLSEKLIIKPLISLSEKNWIQINKASAFNLKGIDVSILKQGLNVITGVSGSGKTSLVRDVLVPTFLNQEPVNCSQIDELENFQFVNWINKSSVAGNSQSTPATFTGVFDHIRKVFAKTASAKAQNLSSSDFSFNSKSGQCPVCKGHGYTSIKLDFVSDVDAVCNICNGQRYLPFVLDIKFNGLNINEVLNLSIDESANFFAEYNKISSILEVLSTIGLGYIKLGQATSTLSGGEAQRLKIAKAILSNQTTSGLIIFDEPSRGLHPTDLPYLTNLFKLLLKNKNTVVVIEHNSRIICLANHVIDLGSGSGEYGGELIYQGEVDGLLSSEKSLTGNYLNK